MKKSKFLLLGSVASLASIPFVAAKCGETKEEKKPEEGKNPDQNTEPKAKIQVKTQSQGKNPSENTEPGKNPRKTQSQAKIQAETQNQAKIQVKKWTLETIWHQAQILKMATIKIHPIKKSLPAIISNSNQQLGEINKNDGQSILGALLEKNRIT
nr:variable surface lipoprotein [Mycoplasmopsis bovis]